MASTSGWIACAGEGLRLALFDLDGRICPPQALWPKGAAAPPIPLDEIERDAQRLAGRARVARWRHLAAQGLRQRDRWRVQQAEKEYVLDPQLMRWQAERDARRRDGLPLAEMPPIRPQRVGEPLTLTYHGRERDVLWACDGHVEEGPVAEIAFHRSGPYAVQLTVSRGEEQRHRRAVGDGARRPRRALTAPHRERPHAR